MAIKRRKLKPKPKPSGVKTRPKRLKKIPTEPTPSRVDIERLGALIEAGYGSVEDAKLYFEIDAKDHLYRLQSIATKAEANKTWKHLEGCYNQAMLLYVFAGEIYEKHPDHHFMSDIAFDRLARWLLKHWNDLPTKFKTWYNVTAMGLEAGSALNLKADRQINRMIALYTGTPMEAIEDAKNKTSVLRRKVKRNGGRGPRKVRNKARRFVRKAT